jgi:hypothetical protein
LFEFISTMKSITDSPTIITDTREQPPLEFMHLPSERGTLQSGDYSIIGLEHDFAIGRKCGSCPIPSAVSNGNTSAITTASKP